MHQLCILLWTDRRGARYNKIKCNRDAKHCDRVWVGHFYCAKWPVIDCTAISSTFNELVSALLLHLVAVDQVRNHNSVNAINNCNIIYSLRSSSSSRSSFKIHCSCFLTTLTACTFPALEHISLKLDC